MQSETQSESISISFLDEWYKERRLIIRSQGKWGFLDVDGNIAIPCQYDKVQEFSEGLAPACMNNLWGFIDNEGKEIIPFVYEEAGCFSEGLAPVQTEDRWIYIDKEGNTQISLDEKYFEASPFKEGLAAVFEEEGLSCIDHSGKVVIFSNDIDDAFSFSEGLASVESDFHFGYIDKEGTMVIPSKYKRAHDFTNGFASVQDDNEKWSVIDRDGNTQEQFADYDYVDLQHKEYYTASIKGRWGIIDKSGTPVIPIMYDKEPSIDGDLFCVCLDGKWGIVNAQNETILPFEYLHMKSLKEKRFYVAGEDKQKSAIIDENGNEIQSFFVEVFAKVKTIKTTIQLIKYTIIALAIFGFLMILRNC